MDEERRKRSILKKLLLEKVVEKKKEVKAAYLNYKEAEHRLQALQEERDILAAEIEGLEQLDKEAS